MMLSNKYPLLKKTNLCVMGCLLYALVVSMSCSNKMETSRGREFTMLKKGDGTVSKAGQFLVMDALLKDSNDSIWYDTQKESVPIFFPIQDDSLRGKEESIEDIFYMLSKGDSVSFNVVAKTLFEKVWRSSIPPYVDSTSTFTFYVSVKDIVNREQVQQLKQELAAKRNARQMEKDTKIIDEYLANNDIQAEKTASGLRYQILKGGSGEPIKPKQKVSIHYAGYLIDSVLFDTNVDSIAKANNTYIESRKYDPFVFTVGAGQVIPGWDEVTLLLKKGSKAKVWIPSPLAYGPRRRSALIAENAILVFDMDVKDVE